MSFSTAKPKTVKVTKNRRIKKKDAVRFQLNKLMKAMPKPEKKFIDNNFSSTVVTSTGVVNVLDAISNGTNELQRIGNKLEMKSLFSRLSITVNATANANFLRVIYFNHKTGGTIGVSSVLQSPAYNSPLNDSYASQIKVLFDKTYALSTGSDSMLVDKTYRKLKLQVEYLSTSSTSNKNTLCALYISDQATNGPTVSDWIRCKFIDT